MRPHRRIGYLQKLVYDPPDEGVRMPRQRCRKRRITCFNPACTKQVKTYSAGTFLKIIDECFPGGHVLRSSFNRNTIKASEGGREGRL